jgi:hypothetical protein
LATFFVRLCAACTRNCNRVYSTHPFSLHARALFVTSSTKQIERQTRMKQKFIIGLLVLSSAGCAGLTHKKDAVATSTIKRVAVVGFSTIEPAPAFNSGTMQQKDPHIEQIFQDLNASLHTTMNWTILDATKMKANPAYDADYHKYMDGFQNKMPPGKGEKDFIANGIMDDQCTRIMGMAGRDALMKALNVDAIFVARLTIQINGTSVMGIGARHPQAKLSFSLYKLGVENPVWFEGGVDGEEQPSVGSTGLSVDEGLFAQYAINSSKTAFAKITPSME